MLSKRNLAMMMTMILVVLVLFLSSAVLKEYWNDYDVNHAAETGVTPKKETDVAVYEQQVLYIGTEENGYYPAMKEWAGYRKKSFQSFPSPEAAEQNQISGTQDVCMLIDGEALGADTEKAAEWLARYVEQGGVVIFYRMPSYQTIQGCDALRELLGIQHLRAESVRLQEIRLFSGFLLGGETHYLFEGVEDTELVDMEREVPWYDISSRTKSYMVGFLSEEEKNAQGLENEDMPAIIWRSSLGTGSVFAVNGDYMKGETALGLLDAMLYESNDYALYSVVNAQNLSVAGFPDLTSENEDVMAEIYGMTTRRFCRDVLWPSLVAGTQKGNWKMTSFVSIKQSDGSDKKPSQDELIDYLKYFNEESTEAGIALGRIESPNLWWSVRDEKNIWDSWKLNYTLAGGYVRKENKAQLTSLLDRNGYMECFRDIRTVVGEYEEDEQILSWLTDKITLQNTTTDAYKHSYKDSFRLKCLETALGYSNVQVDIYRVLWPESTKDEWQSVAEKMASNIDTYWKPFAAYDKTTISESDSRVRNFLNGSVESIRNGNSISIQMKDVTGDAHLLLRTHGEKPVEMTGGTWKQVEEDTYLLRLTEEKASVTLQSEIEPYYKE